jgi:O-antigen/teichoic acid export membrane protein
VTDEAEAVNMRITKIDVMWSFLATFFRAASTALLLPLILKLLPTEEVGLWTIFMSVTFIVTLFDFGFSSSFSRNITYVFTGVRELKPTGITTSLEKGKVNYALLKGTIESMRWFYLRIALIVLFFLATAGTYYLSVILRNYSGDKSAAWLGWGILCLINAYNLYTFYYEALLVGKGLIKKSKQIIVFAQIIFLCCACILLIMGYGIVAIVSSQLIYVLIARILFRRTFFSKEIRSNLKDVRKESRMEILKVVYPNAIKLGLTVFGGILIQRSAVFIGSLYLPLDDIASYGLTRQIFDILSGLAPIYITTYIPLIAKCRVEGDTSRIKDIYLKGTLISVVLFFSGGLALFFFGGNAMTLIKSNTVLVPEYLIIVAMIVSFLEMNHASAGSILLTKNEVPFFKPSIISGFATALMMYIFLGWTKLGLLSLFLAPGLVDIAYQSWKWPLEVIKDLKISFKDIRSISFRNIRT